ncbi:hypothetical protein KEM52_005834, partial [Ascosphaera acerosa]
MAEKRKHRSTRGEATGQEGGSQEAKRVRREDGDDSDGDGDGGDRAASGNGPSKKSKKSKSTHGRDRSPAARLKKLRKLLGELTSSPETSQAVIAAAGPQVLHAVQNLGHAIADS